MGREDRTQLAELARRVRLNVAIDGLAGAGKSTVGKGIAAALDSPYLDTGLMYRALTERVQAQGVDPEDEAQVGQIAANMSFDLERSSEEWAVTEHGKPLSHEALHSPAIDRDVSAVSAHPSVRAEMVRQQREIAGGREIVMVGRDIGTVVLPHAPVKLFVTASPEVRARRRHLQRNTDRTAGDSELSTLRDIRARDEYDQSRPVSPLRPAPGAALVDTSSRSETESLEIALSAVGQALRQTAPNG